MMTRAGLPLAERVFLPLNELKELRRQAVRQLLHERTRNRSAEGMTASSIVQQMAGEVHSLRSVGAATQSTSDEPRVRLCFCEVRLMPRSTLVSLCCDLQTLHLQVLHVSILWAHTHCSALMYVSDSVKTLASALPTLEFHMYRYECCAAHVHK